MAEQSGREIGAWCWIVVAAGFVSQLVVHGNLYAFGILYVDLLDTFQSSKAATAWVGSIETAVVFLVGPVAGILTTRFGYRVVTIIGAVMTAVGFAVNAFFAPTLAFLYFSLGILAGAGQGFIFLAAVVCVSDYFEKRLALANSLVMTGAGVGAFVYSPIRKWLLDQYGWKGTILIEAGILLNCVVCGAIFRPLHRRGLLRKEQTKDGGCVTNNENDKDNSLKISLLEKTERLSRFTDTRDREVIPCIFNGSQDNNLVNRLQYIDILSERRCVSEAMLATESELSFEISKHRSHPFLCFIKDRDVDKLGSPLLSVEYDIANIQPQTTAKRRTRILSCFKTFLALQDLKLTIFCISELLFLFGCYVPFTYLPVMAIFNGVEPNQAVWLVSASGISSSLARLFFGFISDYPCVNRHILYSVSLLISGVATLFVPLTSFYPLLIVYAVIYGAFTGIKISQLAVVLIDLLGSDKLVDSFGMCNLFGGVGIVLGPPCAGWLYDLTGQFGWSFVSSGVVITAAGILNVCLIFMRRCF